MFHKCVRRISAIAAVFLLAFAGMGCGVDTVDEYFDPPKSDGHTVYWSTADRTQHYFSFYTTEVNSSSEVVFLGTDIYYKIYTSGSSIDSVASSVAGQTENAQLSYLKSCGYKTLKISGSTPYPLIKATGSNRLVKVRPAGFSSYARGITVGSSSLGIPWRNSSGGGFQFGTGADSDPRPSSGDSDASVSAGASTYYVDAYAVSIGRNTADSTTYYSSVLHLGSMPIAYPWNLN